MNVGYGRDLDLNLLRVFIAVADEGSVTSAAARLYLTQPAISAALRRLRTSIGAPLFVREGRGVALTAHGEKLATELRPHLHAITTLALAPPKFDPKTSDRTIRLGLSDTSEQWLLPPLLRSLPRMRVISVPVQFRNVEKAIVSRRVDAAVTVADELPPSIRRRSLFVKGFVCVFDHRHVRVKNKISEREYFEREHAIVSYNGDMRGIIEDLLQKTRRVRCSVSSFTNLGALIEGTALLATAPEVVAVQMCRAHPHLRTARLPFRLAGTGVELLWSDATDADDACRFVREAIVRISSTIEHRMPRR
jgi:LysR family transcriptional activator of mexEF-oprN operon